MNSIRNAMAALGVVALLVAGTSAAAPVDTDGEAGFRSLYEELVEIDTTRAYFTAQAGLSAPEIAADMRAIVANQNDAEAAAWLWTANPSWNGMLRTTCTTTVIDGGHASNALPQRATANVNCRILPGVPLIPTMTTGGTDGRFLNAAGIHTYGLSGMLTPAEDNGAHGLNERMQVQALMEGRPFLYEVIRIYSSN